MLSTSAIDRLGERLRKDVATPEDMRLLDQYRRSFAPSVATLMPRLNEWTGAQPTARPAKSTPTIIEKLKRDKCRLSKMQDIAGCRVVLRSPQDQNVVQILLVEAFPGCKVIDRREKPSHGYRAVHVLVTVGNRVVEVQIRTTLQHLWAQLSEAYADALGSAIKYGGGDPAIREFLLESSDQIQQWEARYMMPVAGLSEVEMNAYFWNLELTWTKIAESMKSMVSLTKSNI